MKRVIPEHSFAAFMKGICWSTLVPICLVALTACSGGGGDSSSSTGSVSVGLTDAATTDYEAVYITVQQVAVHKDGESEGHWRVISTPNKTCNLLALVNGAREELGLATLPTGHYTQMRLLLTNTPDTSLNILSHTHPYGNYFIDKNDNVQELTVPSGLQTGIKIVKGFDISTNETTELVLDFDAARSIVQPGSSRKWLLKPTIKVLNVVEYSIIQGNTGQAGILVSAQAYHPLAAQPERVQTIAATVTDVNGDYKLFVEPASYTLVAYKDGHSPLFKDEKIVTTSGSVVTENFSLASSPTGTLTGGPIVISGYEQEQYVTISIRQAATVSGNTEQIEIKSLNVADGGTFITGLPTGSYTAVISTYGKTTLEIQPFTISDGSTTDIGFINL